MSNVKNKQKVKIYFDVNDIEMDLECLIKKVHKDRLELDFPKDSLSLAQYLEEGTEIGLKIFTPSGVQSLDSVVINSPLEGTFVVEYIETFVKIQRRDYSRAPLKTKLTLEINKEMFIASTIDISGGGIKFCSNEELDPDQTAKGKLYLRNCTTPIPFEAVILDNPSLSPDEYTLAYTNISEKDRDFIIKTCFEIDLMMNAKTDD